MSLVIQCGCIYLANWLYFNLKRIFFVLHLDFLANIFSISFRDLFPVDFPAASVSSFALVF